MNAEFQELMRQWGVNSRERADIISKMRINLKERNNGNSLYIIQKTMPGKRVNIDTTTEVTDLFEINGDMNYVSISKSPQS